jgi:PrtD family type I secretion system ABC transporter
MTSVDHAERDSPPHAARRALRAPLGRAWRAQRTTVAAVIAFSLCINLLVLASPLYMLQVYDRVLTSRSVETLLLLSAVAVFALAALAVLDGIRLQLLSRAATRLEAAATPVVLQRVVARGDAGGTAGAPSGQHALRDLRSIANLLSGPGAVALLDLPWCPVFVLLIALFHPLMGVVAAAGVAALLVLAWLDDRSAREPLAQAGVASRRLADLADDGLRHAQVIRAMGMAAAWQQRLGTSAALAVDASVIAGRRSSRIVAASKFLRQSLQVVMLGLGAWLVLGRHVSPGVMLAATVLLGRALAPIESTIAGWRQLVQARGAVRRVSSLLAHDEGAPAPMALPAPMGRVALERVFVTVDDDTNLLQAITLAIEPGEQLGVIGPSGAGKSTLARVLVGLEAPTQGAVRLDGAELSQWRPDALGEHLGWLPQDVQLLDGTVAENIARLRDPQAEYERVLEAAALAGAHEMILRLPHGYDTRLGARGIALSAGQRQLVGLARALFGNPKLVVLDEPNANLDGAGENRLVASLVALRERKVTVVVVTHRPGILREADRVLVMNAGRIAGLGPREAILGRFATVAPLRAAGNAQVHAQAHAQVHAQAHAQVQVDPQAHVDAQAHGPTQAHGLSQEAAS